MQFVHIAVDYEYVDEGSGIDLIQRFRGAVFFFFRLLSNRLGRWKWTEVRAREFGKVASFGRNAMGIRIGRSN